eukprot:CAMPEP_0167805920 /NCGR_PEP_ID=MMETSP0111_2-20121227/21490_1 /TAXON_ID=91324 /ORGANISM="Lotharella globosa, Strain CCCM811" /LENGTH=391 /DNA_ID=CAMNT_0007703215 /DNA_START=59 /DNA_END=1232 /DNA_ORIENTATION=-
MRISGDSREKIFEVLMANFKVSSFREEEAKFEKPAKTRVAAWRWLMSMEHPERILALNDPRFTQIIVEMKKQMMDGNAEGAFVFLTKNKQYKRSGEEAQRVILKECRAKRMRILPWEQMTDFEDLKIQTGGLGRGWKYAWYGEDSGRRLSGSLRFSLGMGDHDKVTSHTGTSVMVDPSLFLPEERCGNAGFPVLKDLVETACREFSRFSMLPSVVGGSDGAGKTDITSLQATAYAWSLGAFVGFRLQAVLDKMYQRHGPKHVKRLPGSNGLVPGFSDEEKSKRMWEELDSRSRSTIVTQACQKTSKNGETKGEGSSSGSVALSTIERSEVTEIAAKGFILTLSERAVDETRRKQKQAKKRAKAARRAAREKRTPPHSLLLSRGILKDIIER